jgi:hypothetical protein
MSAIPQGYQFILGPDGDTGLVYDERSGFTQLIPGVPAPAAGPPESEPKADIRLECAGLPVEVRIRVDGTAATVDPKALAVALAQAYARNRASDKQVQARPATVVQLAGWGCEGAASAVYDLAEVSASGCDVEEVLVFVRGPWTVFQTRLFPRAVMSPALWGRFVTACSGGVHWLGRSPTSVPSLWPASSFVDSGLAGGLRASRALQAKEAAIHAPPNAAVRAGMSGRLNLMLRGGEAPGAPIEPSSLPVFDGFLVDTLGQGPLLDLARDWMCDVENAQDFRGLIAMLKIALA